MFCDETGAVAAPLPLVSRPSTRDRGHVDARSRPMLLLALAAAAAQEPSNESPRVHLASFAFGKPYTDTLEWYRGGVEVSVLRRSESRWSLLEPTLSGDLSSQAPALSSLRTIRAAPALSSPRTIRAAPAAESTRADTIRRARLVSAEYPRRSRGGAATRLHGISTRLRRNWSEAELVWIDFCGVGLRGRPFAGRVAAPPRLPRGYFVEAATPRRR